MAKREDSAMKQAEKQELETAAEQTRSGPVFAPRVDIFESETALTLMADLPGVEADHLEIDLRNNVLTLTASVEPPEGKKERPVVREFLYGNFYRQFTLSERIDQGKIRANLKDGVLRLEVPKVEAAKPRRVEITTG